MSDPSIYTIGWICALSIEQVAAMAFLDKVHEAPDYVAQHDNNSYKLGEMGKHNVVIASLPDGQYGLVNAATVAKDMLHTFPNVRVGLMVGIGGGAPTEEHDIRLGDVVVSSPDGQHGAVFQYDFGKSIQNQAFERTGHLDKPPPVVRNAVSSLKTDYTLSGHQLNERIAEKFRQYPRLERVHQRPSLDSDVLFLSTVLHAKDQSGSCEEVCGSKPSDVKERKPRGKHDDDPAIHYGLIASANQLMKNAKLRDKFAKKYGVRCFEMEAAGLMDHFPCIVIRGICDYSDTHKSKEWQGYAAMTAAAYAKDLLVRIHPNKVETERRLSEQFLEIAQEIKTDVHEIRQDFKSTTTAQRRKEIHDWLSPGDPSVNFNKSRTERHPDTGNWFMRHPRFETWKTQSNSLLWLHGQSGCGKTVLASTIIEHLINSRKLVLYYFFDFRDQGKQTFSSATRSLISQLYQSANNDVSRTPLNLLFKSCNEGRSQPSSDQILGEFWEMIKHVGEVWIVLDALDECCEQREELIAWSQDLVDSEEGNLHFLATSRPEPDIQHCFRNEFSFSVEKAAIDDDIVTFIHSSFEDNKKLARWREAPEARQEIERTLRRKADGMFRWVVCQLDALCNCLSHKELHDTLQTLPITLNDTYERVLRNIPTQRLSSAVTLLQLLTYSEEMLTVDEALDALEVNSDKFPYLNPEAMQLKGADLLRYCPSLVSMQGNNYIQLAHLSVKEYLMSNYLPDTFALEFRKDKAMLCIAKVCLGYLIGARHYYEHIGEAVQFRFIVYAYKRWIWHSSRAAYDKDLIGLIDQFFFPGGVPFSIRYYWCVPENKLHNATYQTPSTEHKTEGPGSLVADVDVGKELDGVVVHNVELSETDLTLLIAMSSLTRSNHTNQRVTDKTVERTRQLIEHVLLAWRMSTAGVGITLPKANLTMINMLLDVGTCLYVSCRRDLTLSVFDGDVRAFVVSNTGAHGKEGKSPTRGVNEPKQCPKIDSLDTSHGSYVSESMSLQRDVGTLLPLSKVYIAKNVDSTFFEENEFLELAVSLDPGMTCDEAQLLFQGSLPPPFSALKAGKDLTIGLEVRADILNPRNHKIPKCGPWVPDEHAIKQSIEHFRSPLVSASHAGMTKWVDTFLRSDKRKLNGKTASQCPTMSSLLDRSLSVDFMEERGLPPLLAAILQVDRSEDYLKWHQILPFRARKCKPVQHSNQRRAEVVALLLHYGAACQLGMGIQKPFHFAVATNNKEVIDILLAYNPSLEVRNELGRTPLFSAVQNRSKEAINLLLAMGANHSTMDYKGRTPLHAAAENGDEMIVKALLAQGAAYHAIDHGGKTPLHLAIGGRHVKLVKFLLELDVEHGAQNRVADSVLDTTVGRNREGSVRPSSLGKSSSLSHDALHLASHCEHEAAEVSVKEGFGINTKDRHGATPLKLAIRLGYPEIAELLIRKGAKIDNVYTQTSLVHLATHKELEQIVVLLLYAHFSDGALLASLRLAPFITAMSPIEKGIDVNLLKTEESILLLFKAIIDCNQDAVNLLVHYCLCLVSDATLVALVSSAANASESQDLSTLRTVLRITRVHIDVQREIYNHLLPVAAHEGDKSVVRDLLELGADINAVGGEEKATALYYASAQGNVQMIDLLLNNGADFNLLSGTYGYAFHAASYKRHKDAVSLMIERGAVPGRSKRIVKLED